MIPFAVSWPAESDIRAEADAKHMKDLLTYCMNLLANLGHEDEMNETAFLKSKLLQIKIHAVIQPSFDDLQRLHEEFELRVAHGLAIISLGKENSPGRLRRDPQFFNTGLQILQLERHAIEVEPRANAANIEQNVYELQVTEFTAATPARRLEENFPAELVLRHGAIDGGFKIDHQPEDFTMFHGVPFGYID